MPAKKRRRSPGKRLSSALKASPWCVRPFLSSALDLISWTRALPHTQFHRGRTPGTMARSNRRQSVRRLPPRPRRRSRVPHLRLRLRCTMRWSQAAKYSQWTMRSVLTFLHFCRSRSTNHPQKSESEMSVLNDDPPLPKRKRKGSNEVRRYGSICTSASTLHYN